MEILLVGNYCHDTLVRPEGDLACLGGSSSYISKAFEAARINYEVVAKVGEDFLYHDLLTKPPQVSKSHPTTHFLDTIVLGERSSVLKSVGEAIFPEDLPKQHAKIGLACGVANELLPETLMALRQRVDFLICDIQGLIRRVGENGEVEHVPLSETPFFKLLPQIDVLKANLFEANFANRDHLGKANFIITEGSAGSRLVQNGIETRVPAPPVPEIDPTGAGDSFVAGLALGLARNLTLIEAIHLGNCYGSLAVRTIGIPDFTRIEELLL